MNIILNVALAIFCGVYAMAAAADNDAGVVTVSSGTASLERAGQSMSIRPGIRVMQGDRVITAGDGFVAISMRDNTHLTLGPNSNLALDRYAFDPKTRNGNFMASFTKGSMRVITGLIGQHSPESFNVNTASATIGIRGTEFVVEAR